MNAEAEHILAVGLEAVTRAEKIILAHYKTGLQSTQKQDGSPVTIADQKAEETIRSVVGAAFPTHGFIGEEFATDNQKAVYQWIIDPIDGTKNFMRGVPFFTTELAVFKNGVPYMGISNIPTLGLTVTAVQGHGARVSRRRVSVSTTARLEDAYIIVGGLKHFNNLKHIEQLLKLTSDVMSLKSLGEAWSYHLLAQGNCDAVIEAQTKIWDIAAQSMIIPEAGGIVTDIAGKPIDLNSTSMLASTPILHKELLVYFAQ